MTLQNEYANILKNEEEFWMLKSRISWLSLGDKNTSFFHKSAIIRRRKNKINHLQLENGTWSLNPQEIGNHIISSLQSTFCDTQPPFLPDENLLLQFQKLTQSNSQHLIDPLDLLEIKNALWNIHPYKTPGDDGFHAAFY